MSRESDIDEYANSYFNKKLMNNFQSIKDNYEKNKVQILKEFYEIFENLFIHCTKLQTQRIKEPISYISIFFLRSSILTGSFDIQINLYNKNFYFDDIDCFGIWRPKFIFEFLEDDMNDIENVLKHKIICLKKYEADDLRLRCAMNYYRIFEQFCKEHIHEVIKLPSYDVLEKDTVKITIGEYLDKAYILYQQQGG